MMREHGVESAAVEAQVRGGWRTNQHDLGNFGVRLKMPRSGWIDFGVGAPHPKPGATATRAAPKKSAIPEPAPNGPLSGRWIALWGIPKDGEVAQHIATAGGKIMASLGKSTNMVVTEEGEITPGMRGSATWRKLEELRGQGHAIEMITWPELKVRITKDGG